MTYKNYIITANGNILNITNTATGAEKSVKVLTDSDFIFKIQKKQIKTMYTAEGLLEWFKKLISDNFGTAYISTICSAYVG